MRKTILIFILFISFMYGNTLFSQSGMKFAELAAKLDRYFDKALILDLKKQLPQGSDYSIWGWDVGDFSGDGFNDVAFSVKLSEEKRRRMYVYLFVDLDGFLTKIADYPYTYLELPLEIGVVIRNNICYITQKNKQFNWMIKGYRYDNGSIILLDEYNTRRIGKFTHESYRNYNTLRSTEKYLNTKTGEQIFFADFTVIPSYPRGKQIYKGYSEEPYCSDIDYVQKGAYNWTGEKDASFTIKSAYDDQFLYMAVRVYDDNVVTMDCDTCMVDNVDIWLDVSLVDTGNDRFLAAKGRKLKFRTNAGDGIFKFSIYPGDFLEKKAYVKISTTDDMKQLQKSASQSIRAVSRLYDDGYSVKFKIPFAVIDLDGAIVEDGGVGEIGCTVVVNDIDNEFRPEEHSEISSSVFSEMNPSTFGVLKFIPKGKWYGETSNIYKDEILRTLSEYGF